MNKLNRLNKLKNLMKIQEREVLIEFKEAQQINNRLRESILDLEDHKNNSASKMVNKEIHSRQFP